MLDFPQFNMLLCFSSTGVPPALAVCEAQVHAVASEKGAGVQRELHAGRVGDGLTQQSHHSGCRGRHGAATKGMHVACTVENLEKDKEKEAVSYGGLRVVSEGCLMLQRERQHQLYTHSV